MRIQQLNFSVEFYMPQISIVFGVSGRSAEAQRVVAELKELTRRRYVPPLYFAVVYMCLGDKDRAF